jgi:ABC-type proline/glycine betaine transport system permease subunit
VVFVSTIFKVLVLVFVGIAFYQDRSLTELTFHFHWAALFPIIAIFFDILAVVGINKDEALIRSLDRIR